MPSGKGKIVLMGSGELTATMVEVVANYESFTNVTRSHLKILFTAKARRRKAESSRILYILSDLAS